MAVVGIRLMVRLWLAGLLVLQARKPCEWRREKIQRLGAAHKIWACTGFCLAEFAMSLPPLSLELLFKRCRAKSTVVHLPFFSQCQWWCAHKQLSQPCCKY